MRKLKLPVALLLMLSLFLPFVRPAHSEPVDVADLNALWTANSVKITFNANGGSGVTPSDQVYVYGVERSLPGQGQMSKPGFTFLGWAETASATTPTYRAGDFSHTAFGYSNETTKTSKTLYAVWKADEVTTIADFLGYDKKASTPTSETYSNASLVEKVNYLEARLDKLESSGGGGVPYYYGDDKTSPAYQVHTKYMELPYSFYYGSAVVYNDQIHILGGSQSDDTKVSHFSRDTYGWNKVSNLPYAFYNGSAVVYNKEIHILGGSGNNVAHYKFNGNFWQSVPSPYYFQYGSAVVYNNEIHILGSTHSSYYTAHYKWDGSSWSHVSTLPYQFYRGSAVVYNNEIHILGSDYSSTMFKYHYKWDGSSWSKVSTLPYNFREGSAVVYNNEIHILGTSADTSYFTAHYKWNGSSWSQVSTLPYNFYDGSAVVYNDEIHILGDAANGVYANHYKWDGTSWKPAQALALDLTFDNIKIP